MSYILDALRKSEQQRQRGAAPTLLAAQAADAAPRRPAVLWYGLLVAALLGMGVAIGVLRPWEAEGPAPQSSAAMPSDGGALRPPEPVAVTPAEPVAGRSPEAVTGKPSVPGAVRSPEPVTADRRLPEATAPLPSSVPAPAPVEVAGRAERQASVLPSATQPAPVAAGEALKAQVPARSSSAPAASSATTSGPANKAPPPAPERPLVARAADAAPQRAVVPFAELPVSIQQEIPKLSILFHLYSGNPKDRLVGINDRMLREGDAVEPGLGLEQITPDGMILNYKGYRFMRGPR